MAPCPLLTVDISTTKYYYTHIFKHLLIYIFTAVKLHTVL